MNESRSIANPLIAIFDGASELPPGDERRKFLDEACGGDTALRAEVEQLLNVAAAGAEYLKTAEATPSQEAATIIGGAQEKSGELLGAYKLLEPIGEGGFGTVWVAEQQRPMRRRVALKILKPGMDSRQVLARFEAERQALAIMDHPNIATVHDGGVSAAGRPFFVMELVKGMPITEFCDKQHLPPRERLDLFLQVCHAVQHAHQKGIIHRDLKPSNILVAMHDTRPVVKVIDFGIAKALGQELTDQTLFTGIAQMIGTPLYMSPEQAGQSSLDVDTRSDIYSLGVLLYELLTGATPFARERFKEEAYDEIRRIIREEEPPKPSTRLSESKDSLPSISALRDTEPARLTKLVRGELDWIVMKALEKDRSRRYETANGFALDVQRYLAKEPVLARPQSRWYVFGKAVQRHKRAFAAVGAVAAAVSAGLGLSSWLYLREREARQGEAEQRELAQKAAMAALEQERIATAVVEFLQNDLLKQADITAQAESQHNQAARFELTQNPTVRELLDRAALGLAPDKIESRFPGQRYVQSMVLKTVGETYMAIGRYPEAVELLERADRLQEATRRQEPHERLANSAILANLGVAYLHAGRLPEAIGLLEKIRDAASGVKGADHLETLLVQNNLASAYSAAGKAPEAIALLERVNQTMHRTLGADHIARARMLVNLAWAYRQNGQVAKQIQLLEEAHNTFVRLRDPNHPDVINALHTLASAYMDAGRLDEATGLMEQIVEKQTKLLGAEHPNTLTGLNNLALSYKEAGRITESVEILERARETVTATLVPEHSLTILILGNLAGIYQKEGNLAEAVPLFEQAAQGIAARGFQVEQADAIIEHFIGCLIALGRKDDAQSWEDRQLAAVKKRDGELSATYSDLLFHIGLSRLERREWKEAEPHLRECLAHFQKLQPDDWTTFATRYLVGVSLTNQKQHSEAERFLVPGYEGMKDREASIPPEGLWRLQHAVEVIADFYEATDQPKKAREWRAQLP